MMVREGSPEGRSEKYGGKDLWNWYVLTREWKSEEVMDEQSDESKEKEVIGEGIGESGI